MRRSVIPSRLPLLESGLGGAGQVGLRMPNRKALEFPPRRGRIDLSEQSNDSGWSQRFGPNRFAADLLNQFFQLAFFDPFSFPSFSRSNGTIALPTLLSSA